MKKETIKKMQEALQNLEHALIDLNDNVRFTTSSPVGRACHSLAAARAALDNEAEQPAAPPAQAP